MEFDASTVFVLLLTAGSLGVIAWAEIHSRRHHHPPESSPMLEPAPPPSRQELKQPLSRRTGLPPAYAVYSPDIAMENAVAPDTSTPICSDVTWSSAIAWWTHLSTMPVRIEYKETGSDASRADWPEVPAAGFRGHADRITWTRYCYESEAHDGIRQNGS